MCDHAGHQCDAEGGALGTYPQSSSHGEGDRATTKAYRGERFDLQEKARGLLRAEGNRRGLEHPENHHRTAKCSHTPVGQPAVMYHAEHGAASYKGLVTCGNVWACPLCAARVAERRRQEIAQAFDTAYSGGYKVVVVTLTFPHGHGDDLRGLLTAQGDALRRLRSGAIWQRVKEHHGFAGMIRSLEVTHGEHGWHPHTHEAWIVSRECDADQLAADVRHRWAMSCHRAGLLPANRTEAFARHAVDVIDEAHCSDYLAKSDAPTWGADRELASSRTKHGKRQGRHPFQLLDASREDPQAAALYLEYVNAMHGRRQLYWSPGLKDWAGVNDISDEEAATEDQAEAELVCLLDRQDWQVVRRCGRRADLLTAAEIEGAEGVARIIAACYEDTQAPPPPPQLRDSVDESLRECFISPNAARELYT